jgi:hypothetical protein
MDETAIVFITLLLLLIITCIFGGSMRPSAPVQSMSMLHTERFRPGKRADDEDEAEKGYEGYEDDEEEGDRRTGGVRNVVPAETDAPMTGGGEDGGSAPHGYIAEEFAAY